MRSPELGKGASFLNLENALEVALLVEGATSFTTIEATPKLPRKSPNDSSKKTEPRIARPGGTHAYRAMLQH